MSQIVTATFIYSGLIDYWGGDGRRWEPNAACVFASFCPETTLGEMIDAWAEDDADMDSKPAWRDVTTEQIRAALIRMLTPAAREQLDQVSELAKALDASDWPKDEDGE